MRLSTYNQILTVKPEGDQQYTVNAINTKTTQGKIKFWQTEKTATWNKICFDNNI
jgi:hypothetical protein